ncbi:MAG TPA: HAMP domain-containing sensor histidine kinase, partial [Thermoanaerobaculia bacterium]|nr:HAMP domain-containing sensor histidine kinase [Thermoanaerobaculia bacterium]
MRLPRGVNALLAVLLLLLIAGVAILAALQYRWIDRLSDAERKQMHANIDFAARHFVEDLRGELEGTFETFARPEAGDVGQRYAAWVRAAKHPALIAHVRVVERIDGVWTLRTLDRDTLQLVDTPWPAELHPLRADLSDQEEGRRVRWPPPLVTPLAAMFIGPRRPPPPAPGEPPPPPPMPVGTLLQLDRATLWNGVIADLVREHFSNATDAYSVALIEGDDVLYRTNAAWPDGRTQPDFELSFIPVDPGARDAAQRRREFAPPPPPREPWHLVVRRQNGGLETLVAGARRRNMAMSFGVLFLLAATALLLVALVRRADRLRAQQAHFVAAVSHELNTPIAALRSAGENLQDGIVADREKLALYGRTIVKEASRLGEMVAQILEFAGMQARPPQVLREPVDVGAIVSEAVAQCQWLTNGTAIKVETHVDGDLPRVRGDAQALTRAVQNLLANAIRYGGAGGWVGLRATRSGDGVAITVEDRGPGIDSRELSRIFEPFYRGRDNGSARGTGLGLAIVRDIARAHGGTIELDARRREGAAFTLRLP